MWINMVSMIRLRLPPQSTLPFLCIDHNGPGLVLLIPQHNSHRDSIQPLDVDGVGDLTGPEDCAAVGVQAQVVGLPLWALLVTGRV